MDWQLSTPPDSRSEMGIGLDPVCFARPKINLKKARCNKLSMEAMAIGDHGAVRLVGESILPEYGSIN